MERNALTFKEYYENNFSKIQKTKQKYSAKNKEKLNEQTRQWHKENPEKSLLLSSRTRARRKELPFNLTLDDIIIPTACPILGIPLSTIRGKRTDNTPSLDRKVPEKGYVKDNIAIVSWRANRLKNDASLGELKRIVAYLESS